MNAPPQGGRGDWVRTSDLLLPKQARYQAAPRPDFVDGFCGLDNATKAGVCVGCGLWGFFVVGGAV